MAGHSKFKNIQHRKDSQDQKKAKAFAKVIREITAAVKSGSDPATNSRLRHVISQARSLNIPKDLIEKALSQSSHSDEQNNYTELTYEGFIDGIAIIITTFTDNRNRTASIVRSTLTKFGGCLGENGCATFMFDHNGIICYANPSHKDIIELAINVDAKDIEIKDDYCVIYTDIERFTEILSLLSEKLGPPTEAHIGWKPRHVITIDELAKAEKLVKFIETLENHDDVQHVFTNHKFSES